MKKNLLALGGAVAGGALGYFGFLWAAGQGFYALILPGGLLGLGAGIVPNRSLGLPVVCGLLAVGLGVFSEYRLAPFIDDHSFAYFVSHLHQLRPLTLLLIAVGGAIGFWVPFRRTERGRPPVVIDERPASGASKE
ncbi:MAG TPA: hypothetical protein VFW33_08440 [Gemmataceae bacterium]|nr:hypothetical protein [Gemmataceae bacterium]